MDYLAQPSPSVSNLGSDRKRKAEDEQTGRRVRSGAPPPSELAMISGVDSMQHPARQWIRDEECRHFWGKESGQDARALEGHTGSSSSLDLGGMPHSTGHWASVKTERDNVEREHDRQRGALCPFPRMSFNQSTPPRHSGYEPSNPLLSPKMYGTPPEYRGRQLVTPGVACVKRKRNEIEDAEDGEVQMRSKRSETNANYIREIAQSKANNTPPPRLPELDATIPSFTYSGLRLGQLLPSGEILGFVELPPVAQLYDIYSISLINPQPEHSWIKQIWRTIRSSIGLHAPTWRHNYWYEEIKMSGTERKLITLRAIKTFRELGERLWRSSNFELRDETLNLFHKEMDYTVLLLLMHRHQEDRVLWEQRLKVLFARLDPALRPTNKLVTPVPAGASGSDTRSLNFDTTSLIQASGLPTVKEESGEHAAFFNAWPKLTGPTVQGYVHQSTLAMKDEPMGMEW